MAKTALSSAADRLYPHRRQPNYVVLTKMRLVLQELIEVHMPPCNFPENTTAVDLGCGAMPYRPLFEPHVRRYAGVDMSSNPLADIHFEPQTGRVPLKNQSAEVIVSTQVLEHVEDPAGYLAEARRIVRRNGLIFLSTHGCWMEHPDPRDYWRWTSDGLAKLLHATGWKVIEMAGVLGFAAAALQLFQQALTPEVPARLKPSFFFLMQLLIAFVDRFYTPAGRLSNAAVFIICAQPSECQQ